MIVTAVPPSAGPSDGEMPVGVGAGGPTAAAWKRSAHNVVHAKMYAMVNWPPAPAATRGYPDPSPAPTVDARNGPVISAPAPLTSLAQMNPSSRAAVTTSMSLAA